MSIEAMKQALEALEDINSLLTKMTGATFTKLESATTSLHQAIEQAEKQEPVAVARVDDLERGGRVRALAMGLALDAPLYTTPPAAPVQEPVGEVVEIDTGDYEDGPHAWVQLYNDISLGTVLYTTPPAAPVQEPVAGIQALRDVIRCLRETGRYTDDEGEATDALDELAQKLTTPPAAQRQWVGLTDDEMRELEKQFNAERVRTSDEEYLIIYPGDYWQWQRAVEAKLREKNTGETK